MNQSFKPEIKTQSQIERDAAAYCDAVKAQVLAKYPKLSPRSGWRKWFGWLAW